MPRTFVLPEKTLGFALTMLVGVSLAISLRAEQPVNPLRPASLQSSARRTVAVPTDAPAGWRTIADDEPSAADPPSIVPHELGQPEPLPAPIGNDFVPGEHFGDQDFSDGSPWQHNVHPLFAEPWFAHGDPNDPRRHIGIGQPLVGTSWRNRPIYFGSFVGGILMDDIVSNQIYQNDTAFVGLRLGFDFDHFWGLEMRGAFARPDLADGSGTPFKPASRDNFADMDLLFYPLGDARWRPYLLAGLGFQTFRFNNELGQRISEAPLMIPIGCGVKYFFSPWFTLRFDFVDNICLGNDRISGMNNISLMCGCEFRFGGRRPSYFPWHNNTTYW
jgi:hypothetical protein